MPGRKVINIFQYSSKHKVRVTTKNLNAYQILQFTNADQSTIAFKSEGKIFVFASCYMPFDSADLPPTKIIKIWEIFAN